DVLLNLFGVDPFSFSQARDGFDNPRLEDRHAFLFDLGDLIPASDLNRNGNLQARTGFAEPGNGYWEPSGYFSRLIDLRLPDLGLQITFLSEEEADSFQIVQQFLFKVDVL